MPAASGRCPTPASTRATRGPTRSATSPRMPAACTCRRSGAWGSARSSRSRAWRPPSTRRSTAACTRSAPARSPRPATGSSWASCRRRRCRPIPTASRPTWWRCSRRRRAYASAPSHPASGTEVIEQWGEHHLRTGEVILSTSADSVLQLAAPHDVLSEPDLLAACATAREAMTGEHAVGRVIARPFEGEPGSFRRTEGRKDFAVAPPGRSYLEELQSAGVPVHAVGKVRDLFAGVGIDEYHPGPTNERGIAAIGELLRELDSGLVFANLVETDQVYGHRHDVEGFHRALREIDAAVGEWLGRLRDDDLLVLTADHGVDPRAPHTDHTREHAPLLATFTGQDGHRHDGPLADVGASTLKWLAGREAAELPGASFL